MNQEVTDYIQKLPEWQSAICENLRKAVYDTVPEIVERVQYGKPHYLKNGHYAAVISIAKDKVSFSIFNAGELEDIKGFFASTTSPDRKTATIKQGQEVDYNLLAKLLSQASGNL
ncbi:DUF1801 domain-containing protein [Dyadobacter psychrotolerans]|uniref:DUF1801 domain-containing protein n=1 Tax=Dyadobacter psychrotolerans TaxID=2541721 RepID=A0A4R5DFP4_9BACT|nr:DUF1801 domain-containing protein [Dyadobacter psychrotolerans]TDE12792.1 DUF1801 domain-containing protein [Dyadobacter psychrotolerans]